MNNKPYIIAELSGNHNGDINRAFKLIEAAKNAGADAVKLQTYTADTMTIDHNSGDFVLSEGPWAGSKLYDLYKEAFTPWEWHRALFNKANELGITIFSTPFDETAVDFLEEFGAPIYKVASFELVHLPLIKYIASKHKPMIMSTGMASIDEIREAVEVALKNGCRDLTLLHCISAYPAEFKDCNLLTMQDLKMNFPQVKIGLSDHSLGTTVSVAAVALGAQVIEKHLTLSRAEGGVDSIFSLEPDEFQKLCEETEAAWLSLGKVNYNRSDTEKKYSLFRRSIYAVKSIEIGEEFTVDNIKVIRPGCGLHPRYFEQLLGTKSKIKFSRGEGITNEK